MSKKCFQCESENDTDQKFCGKCGSALALSDFLAVKVAGEVKGAIQDRNVLETESAIRVFERALGWVKIVGTVAAVLLGILSASVYWKASDWSSTVDKAKQSVTDTAASSRNQINGTAAQSVADIKSASADANLTSKKLSDEAKNVSTDLKRTASSTKSELTVEAQAVKKDVQASRSELEAARKLRPEMDALREQLAKAVTEVEDQRKIMTSTEDLAKHIFSSHTAVMYSLDQFVTSRSIVVPPKDGKGNTVVYMLLPSTPMTGTLQVQYNIFVQPPGSYFNFQNLVIFFWGDPPEGLKGKPMSVSYFPDTSDKDLIRSLSMRDDRVFADDQPLIKLGQSDPDFKGNKWMRLSGDQAQP